MKSPALIAATICSITLLAQCAPAPSRPDAAMPDAGATESGSKPGIRNSPPLRQLPPVPLSAEEKKIHEEVDAEICAAYRRWRAQGNRRSTHMEEWCPTGRP